MVNYPWIYFMSKNPQKYPYEYRYNKARLIVLKFLRITKTDVYGINVPALTEGQKVFFVGNHISFLDPVAIMALSERPITFASKIEAKKFPIIGRVLKIMDAVFLERGNLKKEILAMQTIKKSMLEENTNWGLFPEGTRNKVYDRPILDFKPGSFKLPVTTNTPIQPVAIWGTQMVLTTKLNWRRFNIYVSYLPLVKPSDFAGNTIKIAEHTQQLIQTEVNKLREEYPQRVAQFYKGEDFSKIFNG